MRFKILDLHRYGKFSDRVITFGTGQPDLHVVVGPNEAGKSTMLEAIGDLLFGMHPQTTQGWRFDYGELRIRAVLEARGSVVEVTRRKGTRNTLLDPNGNAISDDILVPLLGGVDRTTFERMYGLDHEKLRAGGRAILEGKDDAARLVLEAGSGLTGVGSELTRLERIAGELFKPNAQIPLVNRLLRERSEAQAIVRTSGLTDAAWSAVIAAERSANEQRAELQAESRDLAVRATSLERTNRARAPLARIGEIDAELQAIADIRIFPDDAEARFHRAIGDRTTAKELLAQHQAQLKKATGVLSSITLPTLLLVEKGRVEALEERRPVIEKAIADIARRTSDLERSEALINAARTEARLPTGAALPSVGWRKRAREYLEDRRALAERQSRLALAQTEARLAHEVATAELEALPPSTDLSKIAEAIASVPADFGERLVSAADLLGRTERKMQTELASLSPWTGDVTALASMSLPLDALDGEHQVRFEGAKAELAEAKLALTLSGEASAKAIARRDSLAASADLPTPEAVRDARSIRDRAIDDVRTRLGRPREKGDEDAGALLASAVSRADLIVDRRDAEADRIAELMLARTTSAEAEALLERHELRAENAAASLRQLEADWRDLLSPLGFVLPPATLSVWWAGRSRALEVLEDLVKAKENLERLKVNEIDAIKALIEVSSSADFHMDAGLGLAATLRSAKMRFSELDAIEKRRAAAVAVLDGVVATLSDLAREDREVASRDGTLGQVGVAIITEAGLVEDTSDAAISDAIEATEAIATEVATAEGLKRQIAGMTKDIASFQMDTEALLAAIGRSGSTNHVEDVRALAHSLETAVGEQIKVERANEDINAAQAGIQESKARAAEANATIAELMRVGQLTDEFELLPAILASTRANTLRIAKQTALHDLVEVSGGRSIEDLLADAAEISADEATAELASIAERQIEIGTERETVGRILRETEIAHASAASETLAADAQQRVKELEAALLNAAERHVSAAATAAVLRWLIGKHRAESQGPLIIRAGIMFQEMTGGSFAGLSLDYGSDDQPRIVGLRPNGERVGVEGMSEGTRDQLYLALRLASIDDRAEEGMPLICDDILITADEPRSAAMLGALRTISKRNQVIIFTHHEHIVELANNTLGGDGFKLHRLEDNQVVSAAA